MHTIKRTSPALINLPEPGYYLPVRDPGGRYSRFSRALVLYMSAPNKDSKGFMENLVSLGAGIYAAVALDESLVFDSIVDALEGDPDGLYVLEFAWTFSRYDDPCDSAFEVQGKRSLTSEERATIERARTFDAITEEWRPLYAEVPCRVCGRPGREHSPIYLKCPEES